MNSLPIVKLEVEAMRRTIITSLSQYAAEMDADIQAAVNEVVTPENIRGVIKKSIADLLPTLIESRIKDYFLYGEGSKTIAAAVNEAMANALKQEPQLVAQKIEPYEADR